MEFAVKQASITNTKSHCLIVAIGDSGKLPANTAALDDACGKIISKVISQGDIKGKSGETLWLHQPEGVSCPRILLVGTGKDSERNDAAFNKLMNKICAALKTSGASQAHCFIEDFLPQNRDVNWSVRQATLLASNSQYRFDQLKSKKNDDKPNLSKIIWALSDADSVKSAEAAVSQGAAIAKGITLTRDLGNLPGNICTPTYLETQAESMASNYAKISTKVLQENDMAQLGMGSLLSVSRGSRQPAKLIIMHYNGGAKDDKPIVLVGKGLTFDSGGISIKPGPQMDEMKYDMCGGASVFGTLTAIAEMALPINVIGVVPASENMPDGDANKPGDIVTSLSGQTIEILNTDAEGRLILCDALTYVERFDPAVVIDIATLTGACVIALGKHASGLFSNDEALSTEIQQAGHETFDRVWPMPLWDDYQDQLDSNFADMANVGGREAGSVTAACFLARYTKKFKWAHLDIAGTAWVGGGEKGATGRPVALLTQFVLNRCAK
ncbi:MAG: leucyl aminopeptidase [Gammaproteobacteria bacterium]|nr:leucyl aminopeptidase [Gammaproteobacteria bacterium]